MLWAVVNLRAVVNIEAMDNMVLLVDPIRDAVGAASGPMTAIERPQQRLADPVRVTRKPGIAKLQRGGSNSTFHRLEPVFKLAEDADSNPRGLLTHPLSKPASGRLRASRYPGLSRRGAGLGARRMAADGGN